MFLYLFCSPLEAWADLDSFIGESLPSLTHVLSVILSCLFRGTDSKRFQAQSTSEEEAGERRGCDGQG